MSDGTLEIRSANSFAALRYIRLNLSGSGAWYGSGNSTPLPNTATVAPFIAEYEDYLGFWSIERNGSNDTWKITVKEEGKSYWVSGIGGWEDKVTANFNSSNGTLAIPFQAGLFTTNNNTYGPLSVGLRGYYVNGTSNAGVTGSYNIATFDYRGKDECTISQTTLTLNSGSEVTIAGFQWYASILEGTYAGYTLTYSNVTPVEGLSLKKVDTDVDEYNKWIGTWNVGEEVWQVDSDIEGYIYSVKGIKGTGIPFSAEFNATDKAFVLVEQEGVATGQLNDTTTVSISLFGNFTYNETNYYYGGGLDIASATLSGTSATLAGCNISSTYGDFTGFTIYGEDVERGDIYNLGSTVLPQSISAYTPSASVKSASKAPKTVRRSSDKRCPDTVPVLSRNDVRAAEKEALKEKQRSEADKNVAIAE